MKIEKTTIKFAYIEIEKHKFHQYKKPIWMKNMITDKILASNKVSFGKKDFKYFIGCKMLKKIDLHVDLPQKWVDIENT